MLTAPAPAPRAAGPRPGGPAFGEWRIDGGGWTPEDGGLPPGYLGWAVPMGELVFDVFDLADPGGAGPLPGGDADTHAGGGAVPPPAEPVLSAVLGVAAMGDEDCLGLMTQAARSVARWQGVLVRAMARFAALRPPEPVDERDAAYSEFAADELACLLAVSPGSAASRLANAHTLASRLPATLDALEAGLIDYGRTMAMIEITEPLSGEQARAVEEKVLAGGGRPSHAAFRQAARRAALKIDPDGAEQRRKHARADRYVATRPLDDGAAELGVKLPAELTEAIWERVDGLAKKTAGPDEPRSLDQVRADTAAELLLGSKQEELAVEVQVTVSLPTLLGLATDPGELEGYGPIPAGLARELAQNATWRRIITDPVDGGVLDVGRRRYPSAALARHVQARDTTCRFPGCARKARKADIDHTQRHVDGGDTFDGNLEVLCRHHHRLKDEDRTPTGWSLAQPAPGHLEWKSPTGRIYRVGPTPADHDPPRAPATPVPARPPTAAPPSPAAPAAGHAGAPTPPTRPTPTAPTPTATTRPPFCPAVPGRRPTTPTRRSDPDPRQLDRLGMRPRARSRPPARRGATKIPARGPVPPPR